MANGIIRLKASFNIGNRDNPVALSVGETWIGKRPAQEQYIGQYIAALPLAGKIHPYLQGSPPNYSMARLNEEMVSEPGFAVAYTDENPLAVWAFGRIEERRRGIGAFRQSASYVFHQFGVTTKESLRNHPDGPIYRKAASALLYCAVLELPETADVYVRIRDGDSRTGDWFRDHAGFTGSPTELYPDEAGLLLGASVGVIRNHLVYHDADFLMQRLDANPRIRP